MKATSIKIEGGQVIIHPANGAIRLTQFQIAELFDVFVSTINSNIRAILKSEVLREEKVCFQEETESGGMISLYNIEMITALAFRLKSRPAELFRQWIVRQATSPMILWKIPGMETMLN